jgi:hypothetical protein
MIAVKAAIVAGLVVTGVLPHGATPATPTIQVDVPTIQIERLEWGYEAQKWACLETEWKGELYESSMPCYIFQEIPEAGDYLTVTSYEEAEHGLIIETKEAGSIFCQTCECDPYGDSEY